MKKFKGFANSIFVVLIALVATLCFGCNKEEKLTIETESSITMLCSDTDKKIEYCVSIPFANIEFQVENPQIISIKGTTIQALSTGSTTVTLIARYNKQIAQAECLVTVLAVPGDEDNPPKDNDDENKTEPANPDGESEQTNPPLENTDDNEPTPPKEDETTPSEPDTQHEPDNNTPDKQPDEGNTGNDSDNQQEESHPNPDDTGKDETPLAFSLEIINGDAEVENNIIRLKANTTCFIHIYTQDDLGKVKINSVAGITVTTMSGVYGNNFKITAQACGELELLVDGVVIGKIQIEIVD